MNTLFALVSMGVMIVTASVACAATGEEMFKASGASCHGMQGEQKEGEAPLKGQDSDTILKKLHGYRDGSYGGSRKQVMVGMVKQHSDDDLKQIADYVGTLK